MAFVERYATFVPYPGGPNLIRTLRTSDSRSGPRDAAGNLILQQNPLDLTYLELNQTFTSPAGNGSYWLPSHHTPPNLESIWASAENRCVARWNERVKAGGASLGVSVSQWKESRDMIVDRTKRIGATFQRIGDAKSKYRRRNGRKVDNRKHRFDELNENTLAGTVLEHNFGWTPLFGDIIDATKALGAPPPPTWVSVYGIHKFEDKLIQQQSGFNKNGLYQARWKGNVRVSLSANVTVSSPNLWMAEGLGLVNPATIVWDLIPWSFLVNMFVNVNQYISSFSDEVGLTITDRWMTKTLKSTASESVVWYVMDDPDPWGRDASPMICHYGSRRFTKVRVPHSEPPKVTLQVKLPKLNWGIATSMSALLLQRVDRLNKLVTAGRFL